MSHTLTNVLVHVVFATKNREKRLTAAVRARLHAYLAAAVEDEGGCAYIVNGGLEHVHLLVRLAPSRSLSDLMRLVKTNSSRWMRQEFDPHFGWQRGYSAFSVSHSQFAAVHGYIAKQEEHHRRFNYEDELVSLLKRNEMEFDERYLWEPLKGAE
jgi:REP element-mobilizing transposase RayT